MANNQSAMCAGLSKGWWWLLTLLGLCLLYYFMLSARQGPVETDLKDRTMSRLSQQGINWATVNLDQRGRDVLLTGLAPSEAARDQAIEISEQVVGVRVVEHQVEVAKSMVMPSLASAELSTSQIDGVVTLSGMLASQSSVNRIVSAAKKIYGDANVVNKLTVSDKVKEAGWLSSVAALLPNIVGLNNAKFSITDSASHLSAEVASDQAKSSLLDKVKNMFANIRGTNISVVEPVVVAAPEPENTALKVCQSKLDNAMQDKKILFAFNAAALHADSYPLLNQIVNVVKQCQQIVHERGLIISGHTDSMGHAAYNMSLSRARANAVRHYLLRSGVDSRLVSSLGYGETQPVASNDTQQGRAQNRRITFTIQHDSME